MKTAIYLRVSTESQTFDSQLIEINKLIQNRGWNIDFRYEEKESGAKADRKQLAHLMRDAKLGLFDTLVIYKLDRLGRSLKKVILTLDELAGLNIGVVIVKEQLDLSTPAGRLQMQIFSAMAEFEREMIRSRVIDGLAAAKARGVELGRPVIIDHDAIVSLKSSGLSYRAIARQLDISLGSITNALKG